MESSYAWRFEKLSWWKFGRGERIRTSDPLRPRQVRYQAALRPDYSDYNNACAALLPMSHRTDLVCSAVIVSLATAFPCSYS